VLQRQFPPGFLFGAATAAYQIEGGVDEGGRGPSIWDVFSHTPGRVQRGETGDVATDHFHRWREDVGHIRELGLDAYRFSIAWSRVQPDGRGPFNTEGFDFYSRLLDELREIDVKPIVTLYHWDLPQPLETDGGWAERQTAFRFAEYAHRAAEVLGDRVEVWTTLNEPWCSAFLGYAAGVHAPGRTEEVAALRAAHHLNLAHGLGGAAVREVLGTDAKIAVTLNFHVTHPDNPESADDRSATAKVDAVANEVFLQPMLQGQYPADLIDSTAAISDWSFVQPGDLELIQIPLSYLGVNYYYSGRVRHVVDSESSGGGNDGHSSAGRSPWVGCADVEFLTQPGPYTAMGWNIDPDAFTGLLVELGDRYPDVPLMITENGAAFDDEVAADGHVHDEARVDYLRRHFEAALVALDRGVDLRGYCVWSLLDNFEWSYGYARRFGIIRIDPDSLNRIWKDSAYWYRDLVRARAITG
jgi:beta-glucosidase